jgi:hypothetical protein
LSDGFANQHTVEEEVQIPDVQAPIQKAPSTKHQPMMLANLRPKIADSTSQVSGNTNERKL